MNRDKDIKFPEKKVDSGWKDRMERDRSIPLSPKPPASPSAEGATPTSREFMSFVKSLATQALMSLGDIPNPMTGQAEIDADSAKEMIDLLSLLKAKTRGNCSKEEVAFFDTVVPELQLKFSRLA